MDAVAARGEEDLMRHAGIVPFLRVVHDLHAEGRVGAIRSREAGSSGRDWPAVKHLPIDRHDHALARLVDQNEDLAAAPELAPQARPTARKAMAKKLRRPIKADFPQGGGKHPHVINLTSAL